MHNLVFFASGSGTNFQSVIDAIKAGHVDARITGLLTNNPNSGAIRRAEENQIPVYIIDTTADQSDQQLLNILSSLQPDLIVLAGYLKKIPDAVIKCFSGKIINIHPSLLPKYGGKGFYGMKVHQAVISNRDRISGCTVHFVDEIYDNGTIIDQTKVPVSDDDTPESLAKKVLQREHELLPKTIQSLLTKTE